MPDSMSSSPLVACLDPRVDEQVVQEQMQAPANPDVEPEPATETAAEAETGPEEPETPSFTQARP